MPQSVGNMKICALGHYTMHSSALVLVGDVSTPNLKVIYEERCVTTKLSSN